MYMPQQMMAENKQFYWNIAANKYIAKYSRTSEEPTGWTSALWLKTGNMKLLTTSALVAFDYHSLTKNARFSPWYQEDKTLFSLHLLTWCNCFIDYKKAFDCMKRGKIIEILKNTEIDGDLRIVTELYWGQSAEIRINELTWEAIFI